MKRDIDIVFILRTNNTRNKNVNLKSRQYKTTYINNILSANALNIPTTV